MAQQLDVINTALAQLKKPPVADLSEQSLRSSAAATTLMANVNSAYETVLRRHGWLCALTYACLQPAEIAGDVNWKYPAVYATPAGCLRVWEVKTPWLPQWLEEIDWISFGEIGPPLIYGERWEVNTIDTDVGATQVIRSDLCNGLAIAYVRSCSYAALDPHVADAIAFDAAARTAWSITGNAQLAQQLVSDAEKKAIMAISVDGTQEGGQYPLAPSVPAMIRRVSR